MNVDDFDLGHNPTLHPETNLQAASIQRMDRAKLGNAAQNQEKLKSKNQLFVRERIQLLLDKDTFSEDGLLANSEAKDLPADGVVTGVGRVDGRHVVVVANDSTVKAGSWGARTVEKIIRATEVALRHELPIFWLIDSADVPRPSWRWQNFRQSSPIVRKGSTDLLSVWALRGRWRVHSFFLRRCFYGGRKRIYVSRLATHGRGGNRRESDSGRDGGCTHAHFGVGLC